MTIHSRVLKMHPAVLIIASFLLVILAGVALLMLPVSVRGQEIGFVDALFTATSAVCVTGLAVVDTGSFFSVFGQAVILVLIQVGGLGLMTISVALFKWMGRSVSFRQRTVMQDLFAHTPREDITSLVKSILVFTVGVEAAGFVLLTLHWMGEYPPAEAAYMGLFHSVSAFCNAGFALFPDSLMRYGDSVLLNATVCLLIVIGGIGFPVLYDIQSWLAGRKGVRGRLSIQTKAVLVTTLILIVSGALMFSLLELHSPHPHSSLSFRILSPLFQSVTCRTAGFNTVDIGTLKDATLTLMIFLMFFGASPGSCGGGVKTTTLALLAAFTIGRIRKRRRVNMFRKSIPNETVTRSVSLVLVSLGFIGLSVFLLLAGDAVAEHEVAAPRGSFLTYMFETVSAFGTVGLSMGITPSLTTWGKLVITGMMFIGRVGVLTFTYIVVGAGAVRGVEYSEENLMIG
jgi:trk system potassium uptake protein TrkH